MDDVGGFFLPQLTQLELGNPQPPLRHPVLKNATLSAAITTSVQHQFELRMAFETLRCVEEATEPARQNSPGIRRALLFGRIVDTTSLQSLAGASRATYTRGTRLTSFCRPDVSL